MVVLNLLAETRTKCRQLDDGSDMTQWPHSVKNFHQMLSRLLIPTLRPKKLESLQFPFSVTQNPLREHDVTIRQIPKSLVVSSRDTRVDLKI